MKKLFVLLISYCCAICVSAQTSQESKSLVLSQESFRLEQTDALTGINIDPIGKDPSNRKCARIKMGINRMTPDEISKVQVKIVGGNVVLTKRVPMRERGGLELEMTARNATFYLYHPVLGESNTVTVPLEEDKVYLIDAWAEHYLPMTVFCAREGAEVYVDGVYRGKIDNVDQTLTITGIMSGNHHLKVVSGNDVTDQYIELTSDKVFFNVELRSTAHLQQFVVFRVQPSSALLELNGEILEVNDGVAQKLLKYGTYDYSVVAKGFLSHSGKVVVDREDGPIEVNVSLPSFYGKLDIAGNSCAGASVYVDNEYIGSAPIIVDKLSPGVHEVKIVKTLYKTFSQSVEVKEGKSVKLTPVLEGNYGTAHISSSDLQAAIYVNDEFKAKGSWKGNLSPGAYLVDIKRENHKPGVHYFEIKKDEVKEVLCPSPSPITGSLAISSTPIDAELYLNGVRIGKTPYYSAETLVGNYNVKIVKPGYKDWIGSVKVQEDKFTELTPTMHLGSSPDVPEEIISYWRDYNRGYSWSVGYNAGCSYDGSDFILDIYTSQGYQFSPYFYMGAHLGVALGGPILETKPVLPIAALDLRGYFCNQILYMGTRVGYPYIADIYMGVQIFVIGMEVLFSPSHFAFGFNVMF